MGRQMSQIDEFTPAFCGLVTSELPGRWAIWTFKTPSNTHDVLRLTRLGAYRTSMPTGHKSILNVDGG
jgi:hypothetical protein